MEKQQLFPGLIGPHKPDAETRAVINEDTLTVLKRNADGQETETFRLSGDEARKTILHLDERCRSGMSPNQAINEWFINRKQKNQ